MGARSRHAVNACRRVRGTNLHTLGPCRRWEQDLAAGGGAREPAEVPVARGILSASELLQQVAIQLERFRCLTMERLKNFLGAEREFFDTHAHSVFNGVGDRCRGPETG